MKTLRDLSWKELIHALERLGYQTVRQKGSHIRLVTHLQGQHHVTVPVHDPIRVGTLNAIVADVAIHFRRSRTEIMEELFQ